ncbi:DUF4265 domain-containing protein [Streptomyces sp. NBC_01718]|uniref:DUF4265 domain-containing protein n=1 Tax=Streptomyces sp. NBC_01718 TaxID=2975919 RepID=UPI00352BE63D
MEVQVRNTPFYVKGIAVGDIVRVRADHERREFVFEEFVSESGHSTVRIIIKDDDAGDMVDATPSVPGRLIRRGTYGRSTCRRTLITHP